MGTTTVLFTDLASSTEVLVEAGDDGIATLTAHLRSCRDVVEREGGRVTKTMGDGVMALFDSSYQGITAAIALQQATDWNARRSGHETRLRVGVHVGEVITDHDVNSEDAFGSTVVAARRLCDGAEPGQVLVSDLVRQLVGSRGGLTFTELGARRLKGMAEPLVVWEVPWDPVPDERPLRVIVADDVALVRTGVVRLLADEGFEVVADVGDHDGLLEAARELRPDLVVTDIRMPPTQTDEGIRAAATIRGEQPEIAVLVLSQHFEPAAAALLLTRNPTAVGYLLKERVADLDDFVATCRAVAGGACVIDPLVTSRLVSSSGENDAMARLTDAERQVLDQMAQGRSNSAIGRELFCSPKTVESHVRMIFTKLDLEQHPDDNRRVAAVVKWLHATRDGGGPGGPPAARVV